MMYPSQGSQQERVTDALRQLKCLRGWALWPPLPSVSLICVFLRYVDPKLEKKFPTHYSALCLFSTGNELLDVCNDVFEGNKGIFKAPGHSFEVFAFAFTPTQRSIGILNLARCQRGWEAQEASKTSWGCFGHPFCSSNTPKMKTNLILMYWFKRCSHWFELALSSCMQFESTSMTWWNWSNLLL